MLVMFMLTMCYRVVNVTSKDGDWCDTLPPFALLFRFAPGGNVTVIHPDGVELTLDGAAAINTFPYDNRRLTMCEIVEELNLPSTLPDIGRINEFCLGEYLWSPVAQFELEYSINSPKFNAVTKHLCIPMIDVASAHIAHQIA